jgi:hypothetical protein
VEDMCYEIRRAEACVVAIYNSSHCFDPAALKPPDTNLCLRHQSVP